MPDTSARRLENRVAIITGASRGIGRATAERFAQEGAAVVVADVDEEAGHALAEEIGNGALFVRTDVAEPGDAEALVRQTLDAFGQVDILVNNAGITRDASLKKMTAEQFDAVLRVNLRGVFACTRAVVPPMTEAGYGRILSAASVVAHHGNFGQTNYVAAKAGVIGMTKTWARELGRKGITVNAVAPGFIDTEMARAVPEKVLQDVVEKTPLQRLGAPEEVAAAYAFLASEEAGFITGAVLNVDGGLVV